MWKIHWERRRKQNGKHRVKAKSTKRKFRRRNTYLQRTNGCSVEDWQGKREKAARGEESGALIESVKQWKNIGGSVKRKMNASGQWVRPRCFSLYLYLSFLARWHLIFRTSTLIWLILPLSASNIRRGRESQRFLGIVLFVVKLLERNLPSVLQFPGSSTVDSADYPWYFKSNARNLLNYGAIKSEAADNNQQIGDTNVKFINIRTLMKMY